MKLLRITADGLPLFREQVDLTFYSRQRVAEDDRKALFHLFSNVYMNPVNGLIGINASGKTSALKLILLTLGILNNDSINHLETRDILGADGQVCMNTYFYAEDPQEVCRLETHIAPQKDMSGELHYVIADEKLWTKAASSVITKKAMLDFDGMKPSAVRERNQEFLPDDVSIIIAYNRKTGERVHTVSLLHYTNFNVLPFTADIAPEVITFLDPTIEYLHFEKRGQKKLIRLKFHDKDEILLNDAAELNGYLSSGTIKGMITFTMAMRVLSSGGYMVVDELENHFNKEIVMTMIRLFTDGGLNKKGGSLIFSTHYPEILDEFDRNDCIYITRNRDGITVDNLSTLLRRNDIKKSDAYQSGFLEGTTPAYEAYMQLKKSLSRQLSQEAE